MSAAWEVGVDWGLLSLRLGLGLIFLVHGYPKMTGRGSDSKAGREHFAESIRRLGLPYPFYLATFFGGVEFFGGLMTLFGIWTRLAALALAAIMVVASGRNFIQKGFLSSADFPFSLLTSLIALALMGGGGFSLDRLVFGP